MKNLHSTNSRGFSSNRNVITFIIFITFLLVAVMFSFAQAEFITTWKTDNAGTSNDDQITIPAFGGNSPSFDVDWGDGNTDTGVTGSITHTYSTAGTYTISISGKLTGISFSNSGDKDKLLSVDQWGDINSWSIISFYGCSNMDVLATDAPNLSSVTTLSSMFRDCSNFTGNIGHWDVSNIRSMQSMFRGASAFDENISNWDVSSVTNMREMFRDASSFNQDLNTWDVGQVNTMYYMFFNATDFDGNIGNWDLSAGPDMTYMLANTSFNQDVSSWDLSNVEQMTRIFQNSDFNQDIGAWDMSNVIGVGGMFSNTPFNQDISSWNLASAASFAHMFANATEFNQDLSSWTFPNCISLGQMFEGATSFNQDLSAWDVSNMIYFYNLFDNTALSITNYDLILDSWSQQMVQSDLEFGALNVEYCFSSAARQSLIDTYNWSFVGDTEECYVQFTDDNFRAAILAHDPVIDTDGDGEIQFDEAEATLEIDVYNYTVDITSLGGIEAFTNLMSLNAGANALSEVDLSSNTSLTTLLLHGNDLTSVDLTMLTELDYLVLNGNLFSSVDLSQNTKITELQVGGVFYLNSLNVSALTDLEIVNFGSNGNLSSIDLSNNTKLQRVSGGYTSISSIDVSMLTDLNYLDIQRTQISSIDVTKNSNLVDFYAQNNDNLTTIKMANGNNLNMAFGDVRISGVPNLTCISVDDPDYVSTWDTYFDVPVTPTKYCDLSDPVYIPDENFKAALVANTSINTDENEQISYAEAEAFTGTISANGQEIADATGLEAFINITALLIHQNDLTELDLSKNTALEILRCYQNDLTTLDLSNNPSIYTLAAFYNQLTEVVFPAENSEMSHIELQGNMLSSIDVTNLPLLNALFLTGNNFSDVDISNNLLLERLVIDDNSFTAIDLSNHPEITVFYAPNNDLQSLNVKNGANENITSFDVTGNANLTCIEVDDAAYSAENWENVDETAEFRISCDPNAPVYIPDENFKNALVNHNPVIDTNNDDEISYAEAEAYTGTLSAFNREIEDATGIEAFTNITQISMRLNDLTEIDISNNTEVTHIDFYANQITSLDLSKNTKLIRLDMTFHMLTDGIDVSSNILLEELLLNGNGPTSLTSLDVSQNVNLRSLVVHNNPDLSSIDLSNNPELITFTAVNDSFESIDFSNNTKLEYVNMSNNLLTSLDVSNSPNLVTLSIDNFGTNENAVSSLDVSSNPLLEGLYFQGNPITSIDVSNNLALKNIRISESEVTSLNLDSNPLLEVVQAENVSTLTSLSVLNGNNSAITTFNTTGSTNISCIQVSDVEFAQANWTIDPANEFCCFINIPDENFKAALVANASINTDMDDEISCDEAEAFAGQINLLNADVEDLTGIEAFANLTELYCPGNLLTVLDVSANTKLTDLNVLGNSLTSLDISQNILLQSLDFGNNQLISIDVSENTALTYLGGYENQLTSLDVSNNPQLVDLSMSDNQIETLDISGNSDLVYIDLSDNQLTSVNAANGNNTLFEQFYFNGNPELTCLTVDDVAYSETNWSDGIDEQTNFSFDCSNGANDILTFSLADQTGSATIDATNHTVEIEVEIGTNLTSLEPTITISDGATISPEGVQDFTNSLIYTVIAENFDEQEWTVTVTEKTLTLGVSDFENLKVYPNPAREAISIEGVNQPFSLRVLDINGREVMKQANEKEINLSSLKAGMYLLQVALADGSAKVIRLTKTN